MCLHRNLREYLSRQPLFHCGFSSPFVIEEGGTRTSTVVYDLQCKHSDAKELITLLQETCKTDPQSIRVSQRDMNAYKNAIRKQNSFLAKSCVVPIKGVTMEATPSCFMYPTKFHKSLACSTLSHIKNSLIKSGGV